MEAAPRLQMLCYELKHSPKPAEFAHPLKKFIAGFYNEDPANYSKAIHDIEQLRVAACMASKDIAGVAVLKRYYSQLRSLQNRFPMTDDGAACVAFMWTDLYSGRVFNIADVKYELSSVLYNIGALHSQLGALEDRTGAEGMKSACAHFQMAAWAFQHNRDSYPQPKGCDLSHDLLTFYSLVMLGQSQECILEKSLLDNRKPTISAKIAAQIVDFYGKAMNHLTADIKDIVGSKIYLQWKRICDLNASYYGALAALHMGMGAEEERSYGLRVAWYREAMRRFTESVHAARDLGMEDLFSFTADVIGGKLNAAEKENDFVYHDKVPAPESLPEVKGAVLVKGIPFDPCDPEVSGPDLFASLIPMGAHEASSVYSEKKAQILRRVSDIVEDKNAELAAYESNLNLDKSILNTMLIKPSLPPDVIESCARFHTRRTAVSDLGSQLTRLHKMADDIATLLQEADAQIKEARPGGVTSNVVADLRAELNKYREIHSHSSRSNDTLKDALKAHDEKLALLQYTPDILQQKLPHVIEATAEDAKVINELIRLFDKMDEMRAQRNKLFTGLRDAIRNDDITKLIVAHAQEDLNEVFEKALSKHEQAIAVLEKNLRAQENILKAVTQANANAAEVRLNLEQARQPWNAAIEGLRASAKAFEEVEAQTLKGLDFFDKFHGNVSKLVNRLKSVVQVEREQEERLKMRQAAESAAAAAAVAAASAVNVAAGQPGQQVAAIGAHMGHGTLNTSFAGGQAVNQPGTAPAPSMGGQPAAPKLKDYLAMMSKAKQQGINGTGGVSDYVPQAMPGSPGISYATSGGITSTSAMGPATSLAPNAYASPQMSAQHQHQQHHTYPSNPLMGVAGSTADVHHLTNPATPAQAALPSREQTTSTTSTTVTAAVQPTSITHGYPASAVYQVPLPTGHLQQAGQHSSGLMPSSQQPHAAGASTPANCQTVQQPSTFTAQQQSQFYNAYNTNSLGYSMYGGAPNYPAGYGAYAHLYASPQTASASAAGAVTSGATSGTPTTTAAAAAITNGTANPATSYYGNAQGTFGTTSSSSTSVATSSYTYPAGYQYPQGGQAHQYAHYTGTYTGYPASASAVPASSQAGAGTAAPVSGSAVMTQTPTTGPSQGSATATTTTTISTTTTSTAVSNTGAVSSSATSGSTTHSGPYGMPYASASMPTQYTPQQLSYAAAYGQLCGPTGPPPSTSSISNSSSSSSTTTAAAATTVTKAVADSTAINTTPAAAAVASTNSGTAVPAYPTYQTSYQWAGYGNLPQASPTASATTYITSGASSVNYPAPSAHTSATTSAAYNSQQYAQYYQQYAQQYQQYNNSNNSQQTTGGAGGVAATTASQANASTAVTGHPSQGGQMQPTASTGSAIGGYANSTMGVTAYTAATLPQQGQTNNQPTASGYGQQLPASSGTIQPSAYGTHSQVPQTVTITQNTVARTTTQAVANNLLDESPQLPVAPAGGGGGLASILQPTIVSSGNGETNVVVTQNENQTPSDIANKAGGDVSLKSNGLVGVVASNTADILLAAAKSSLDNSSNPEDHTSTDQTADCATNNSHNTFVGNMQQAPTITAPVDQSDTTIAPVPASVDPLNDPQVAHDLKNTYDKLDDVMRALRLESRWKEYLDIQEAEARTLKISVGRICSMKNRFPDIMPYDYNRIVLTSSKDDYINASLVASSVESEPNYIITQAPLAATLEDFWRMVWEQRVETVLSLSSFQELSSQLFFPSEKGTSQSYGPFNVSVLSFSEREGGLFTERLLAISGPQGPTRNVILVHETQWSREASHQIELADHVLDLHLKQRRTHNPPIVIQCLGGCGRSGILAFALRWISHLRVGRVPSDAIPILRALTRARKLLLLEQDQLRTCLEIALMSTRSALQARGLIRSVSPAVTTLDQMDEKQRTGQALSAEERIIQDLMQGFQAKTKITRESFERPRGLDSGSGVLDPSDPLSQLDPLWSLKK